MKAPAVPLIDRPRPFAINELFFSTTDPRGIITSGNDVFVRISGYSASELVGQAHNLVRHPDMPRSAFRLVWDRLKAGRPAAALVKNLAKDGCYYWVMALITPTADGFLSVRFKPTSPHLACVERLYARMRAAEGSARDGGADLPDVMNAGDRVLAEGLGSLKFADYDAFMWALLCDELRCRDAAVTRGRLAVVPPLPRDVERRTQNRPALKHLTVIYQNGCLAYGHLNRLYERLDRFVALNETLSGKSAFVNSLTDELRLSSVNVALASTRLGGEGEGLGVISQHMDETSGEVAVVVRGLVAGIGTLSARLRGVAFNLASARLQVELVLTFLHELITSEGTQTAWRKRRDVIRTLHGAFATSLGEAGRALQELEAAVHPLGAMADCLGRHMMTLQVTQVGGLVESTRIASEGNFSDIFVRIREQIERTHTELSALTGVLHQLDGLAKETPAMADAIVAAAHRMEQDIRALPVDAEAGAQASAVDAVDQGGQAERQPAMAGD